ncbi:MAG TPA: exopolysaccharide biosynthesis protein [Nitrosomonas sp.]|nr:exopolysaccharide biosynthesis protein [Nitrosomonas sp.]HQX14417.1 exopolysaccharide biosynthesis protein [Nitrosomonas sp.]HRB32493.1 exopolysaccharide biosynthesis protein [Nitrosomonas sp.]HRB45332.1 exopolysaccharide biosynthesis protein [Nitrosomonas sp.]HRB76464.1 exopolysaccharide biosynthesis protein [Nitrosomonas sp.]
MTPEENKEKPTSDFLAMVIIQQKNSSIAVGEIKNALHERGFGILMAIAAIPICLPIPAPPGYTTLFSLPLFIFSLQMIFGMHAPWLPEWLERKSIEKTILEKMLIKADPWLKKIEKYMKPRLTYIAASTWERFIGIFAFVFAISIAIPLPLTNFLPGLGILIMSLGLVNRDGLTILSGMLVGTVGIGVAMTFLLILWLGISMPEFF